MKMYMFFRRSACDSAINIEVHVCVVATARGIARLDDRATRAHSLGGDFVLLIAQVEMDVRGLRWLFLAYFFPCIQLEHPFFVLLLWARLTFEKILQFTDDKPHRSH